MLCRHFFSALFLLLVCCILLFSANAARAQGSGGLGGDTLWVHANLGQPGGDGGGAGSNEGIALRYRRIGEVTDCIPVEGNADYGPWYGSMGNPVLAEVVLVDRSTNLVIGDAGIACLTPEDLVAIPTPGEVLEELRKGRLPHPTIETSPQLHGLTGLENYFWYSGGGTPSGCTVSETVLLSLRGFSISATAVAVSYEWGTGDGRFYSTNCAGTPNRPAVIHTYQQKNDSYHLTLRMTWTGTYEWNGYGDSGSGTLGSVTLEGSRDYPVAEVRSVLRG